MILLGKKELKSKTALLKRKAYLNTLIVAGRPDASPSSQEWVSDEYYQGHKARLEKEVIEIDAALRKLP